jgi:hypothetical protein
MQVFCRSQKLTLFRSMRPIHIGPQNMGIQGPQLPTTNRSHARPRPPTRQARTVLCGPTKCVCSRSNHICLFVSSSLSPALVLFSGPGFRAALGHGRGFEIAPFPIFGEARVGRGPPQPGCRQPREGWGRTRLSPLFLPLARPVCCCHLQQLALVLVLARP